MSAMAQAGPPPSVSNTSTTTVWLNGTKYTMENLTTGLVLNSFIRDKTPFHGTKKMCFEGGCGSCGCAVTYLDADGKPVTHTINSCLRPLVMCNGFYITTIDGIGNAKEGYHPLQAALADWSGTQCGYCSPGMVMAMYDCLANNPNPTAAEVEKHFDGNICRCTGYRPILDAFKSFSSDWAQIQAERSGNSTYTPTREGVFPGTKALPHDPMMAKATNPVVIPPTLPAFQASPRAYTVGGHVFVDAVHPSHLQMLLKQYGGHPVFLVAGHTSPGVTKYLKPSYPRVYINLFGVREFHLKSITSTGLKIGAMVTLNDTINFIKDTYKKATVKPQTFPMLAAHLERVAGHLIRNAATLTGNLMLTHNHQSVGNVFISDAYTPLMAVGATVDIMDASTGTSTTVDLTAFNSVDMTMKYISAINIPFPTSINQVFRSYKATDRHANSHSWVNAGFSVTVDPTTHVVTSMPTLVYGGVSVQTSRMTNIEKKMVGMKVTDQASFQMLAKMLKADLVCTTGMGGAEYVETTGLNLFYKFFLSLQPNLPSNLVSASIPWMTRKVSCGSQSYQPHPAEEPVGEAIEKISAKKQTSGEAEYVDDIPVPAFCLHAAFVKSTVAIGEIDTIDVSAAMAIPGVVRVLTYKDTADRFVPWLAAPDPRPLFSPNIEYNGQPVALVLAEADGLAYEGAAFVKVTYKNVKKPILTCKDAVAAGSVYPPVGPGGEKPLTKGNTTAALATAAHVFKGSSSVGSQIHFHMEQHVALAVPHERDTLDVYCPTQMPAYAKPAACLAAGLAESKVNLITRRLGGGYGGKLVNNCMAISAASFAATLTNSPVKVVFGIADVFEMLGTRHPCDTEYTVGVDDDGKLVAIELNIMLDCGVGNGKTLPGESQFVGPILIQNVDNCYNCPNWKINITYCKTNQPAFTWVRGPGWCQATYIIERIMNEVAAKTGKDPLAVRQMNFYKKGVTTITGDILSGLNIQTIWDKIIESSKYNQLRAACDTFNGANRWRKRGLSLVPVKYTILDSSIFSAVVTIMQDGTVQVVTGGIEMGQGLHTKVAMVVAQKLGIGLDMITVDPTQTNIDNLPGEVTGGSVGSEESCLAASNACDKLLQMLAVPIKMNMKMTDKMQRWKAIVKQGYGSGLMMSAKGKSTPQLTPPPQGNQSYNTYSAALCMVEVDLLTGETEALRMDLVYDCGYSLAPTVDIGQCEGAWIMGLGYYLNEMYQRDATTGQLIQRGTWQYKVPTALDIPESMNVTLLGHNPNKNGFMSSKAVGEPPLVSACSAAFAVEDAVRASLAERMKTAPGEVVEFAQMPATMNKIVSLVNIDPSEFMLA
eukprot:TRINITY_DN33572_c0_g1_i1.p1 TRINITY_DN33572_c0_g1~~TRINITY_DN33572_c0_g1_i1.p1  ORF type:complete len:1328 (+),score=249.38 TRINITY_DN33572_c0_g1_i1:43-4026(+)